MEVIRGPILPRCAAPALTSGSRIGGQLLRRVRMRRRASCGGGVSPGDGYDGVSPRFFGAPTQQHMHGTSSWPVRCGYGSSSDGDGAPPANFDASGEEFVDSSVMEAVELRCVSDGFVIRMRDGRNLRCVQNNPRVLRLRDSTPHHAIVLKMEDGSDLLLPIIVSMYLFLPCLDTFCNSTYAFLIAQLVLLICAHAASSSGDTKYHATGRPSEHSDCKTLLL
ncbi:unnamed protein product [Triticum turgidum subsp. durum]|uniref:BFN domain-containing protein n=1 Tax=Triticum turgidum subsp. durum TaxID=4567 RepID=A0A9R0YXQ3_TRITD|nr:unnamed protein product [Triticum turgidum subsp. durum]